MTFTREFPVKAVRKRHLCECCRKHIEIGLIAEHPVAAARLGLATHLQQQDTPS